MSERENPTTHSTERELVEERVGAWREIWDFLRVRKKFWLAPIIVTLLLLGFLILFAGSAGVVSPFVYMM